MKIAIEFNLEEVASVKSSQSIVPIEILERAAVLGAEDAGPAPATIVDKLPVGMFALEEIGEAAFSRGMAMDGGKAPKDLQSGVTPEIQVLEHSIEPSKAKDAGKAALL